ncbi:MAG: formate--tetrahydrofolate ligase, partial [Clostridia bacterium]|nr:formate--tetrahydrofolate ligase [Clostridia bacterium]
IDDSIENKIKALAETIYGASGVQYTAAAKKTIEEINALGASSLPVCVAKTQYSLSDDPKLLCRPKNFEITVRDLKLSSGAGFIVVYLGDILTMPGLPKVPAANSIDIDNDGNIVGLF